MTDCHVNECNILWKIEDFSVCTIQNRHYIKSPIFISKVINNTVWNLLICLDGEDCEKDHLGLNLNRKDGSLAWNSPEDIGDIFFDVSLVNTLGRTSYHHENTLDLTGISLPEFVERSAVFGKDSQLLMKDVLTLKGRLWKYSSRRASTEKVLLRSTLRMEKVKVQFRIDAQAPIQVFPIECESVRNGYMLTCMRSEIDPGVSFEYTEIDPPTLNIEPLTENETWTFMSAKIALVGRPRQPICHLEGCTHFGRDFVRSWLLPHFQGRFDQFCYYHYDYMYLLCKFVISNLDKESVCERRYSDMYDNVLDAENAHPRIALVNDMRPLLQDPTFSDVLVQVGKVRIPAHRVVLSARSQIFRLLFTDPEKYRGSSWRKNVQSLVRFLGRHSNQPQGESLLSIAVRESGVSLSESDGRLSIVFSDVEERVVRKIVSFMYTDDLGCVDHDTVIQLLFASKRYRIQGLKCLCESLLQADTITIENACRTLSASHRFLCTDLTIKTLFFINDNIDCILFHLDSLRSDHSDKRTAEYFGLVRGENRNTELFPL